MEVTRTDLGLTLHRDTEEASLAARARYMDYLSTGLPCVLGRGDETAERFEESGFATLVEAGSPGATANAILALLDETCAWLRDTFRTTNALTLPISGTGSAPISVLMPTPPG